MSDTFPEKPDVYRPVGGLRFRSGIIWSLVFHVALLAVLIFVYIPKNREEQAVQDPSSKDPLLEKADESVSETGKKTTTNAEATIQTSVEAHVETSLSKPAKANLKELDKRLRQLDHLVDSQSIAGTVERVAGAMGLDTDQYQAKPKSSSGRFDPDTAQLIDVKKSQDPLGEFPYSATMVDANGNETVVPMGQTDGEIAFNTFEKMKEFPLVQGLYRQIVMPMLQKIVRSGELEESPRRTP